MLQLIIILVVLAFDPSSLNHSTDPNVTPQYASKRSMILITHHDLAKTFSR